MEDLKAKIGEVFNELADSILAGDFTGKVKVGLTILGSEHGIDELVRGAHMAVKKYKDIKVVLIGPKVDNSLETIEVQSENEAHKKMDELLDEGELDAAVTMHYSFPIGVSSVGKVITPGFGKELIIATTTGTSSINRVEGMVKNTLHGIITAKALGITEPTVGILNVDGARQVERALRELSENGHKINFSKSLRADGGCIMRGNDLLTAASDVMVMDTLTGNIMMKMFSSFTTGGNYESSGFGYGPGVGDGYEKVICILSRASGASVVCEALGFAASCVKGKLTEIAKIEYDRAKNAGLEKVLNELTKNTKKNPSKDVKKPEKKVVTESIAGIDILELDKAVDVLASAGIYSESGMGCTGPIVLTAQEDYQKAVEVLFVNKLITQKPTVDNC